MAGLYYEQFEPGHVFHHAVTRTVTETDNLLITTLSDAPSGGVASLEGRMIDRPHEVQALRILGRQ